MTALGNLTKKGINAAKSLFSKNTYTKKVTTVSENAKTGSITSTQNKYKVDKTTGKETLVSSKDKVTTPSKLAAKSDTAKTLGKTALSIGGILGGTAIAGAAADNITKNLDTTGDSGGSGEGGNDGGGGLPEQNTEGGDIIFDKINEWLNNLNNGGGNSADVGGDFWGESGAGTAAVDTIKSYLPWIIGAFVVIFIATMSKSPTKAKAEAVRA